VLARRRGWEVRTILALIIINLLIGFASTSIDWRAHLGGMITGAVVTVGLARSAEARRTAGTGTELVIGAVTTVAVIAVLFALTRLPPGHVNLHFVL
jgi:Rhomboid family